MEENRRKKTVSNIVLLLFFLLFCYIIFCVAYGKINNQEIFFFGIKPYFLSQSTMEPEIKKDALVFVRKTDAKDIRSGDIVSYISEDSGKNDCRKVGEITENGFTAFNGGSENPDLKFIKKSSLSGKVVFVFNPMSDIIAKTKTPSDLLKFIILPVAAVFLVIVVIGILCIKAPKKGDF